LDHIKYEVEINFNGHITNMYVDVRKNFPDELHDLIVKKQVLEYFEERSKITYKQKMF